MLLSYAALLFNRTHPSVVQFRLYSISFRFSLQPNLLFHPCIFCTTRGAHKRCSMSTPLVNHRPLKGKETGYLLLLILSTARIPPIICNLLSSLQLLLVFPLIIPIFAFRTTWDSRVSPIYSLSPQAVALLRGGRICISRASLPRGLTALLLSLRCGK